jgi:GNAT superfamily N-acetyltransferase
MASRASLVYRYVVGHGGFIAEASLTEPEPCCAELASEAPLVALTDVHCHPLRRRRGWASIVVAECVAFADAYGFDVYCYPAPFGNGAKPELAALWAFYADHGFAPCDADLMIRRHDAS